MRLESAAAAQISDPEHYEISRQVNYPAPQKLIFAGIIPRPKLWSFVAAIAYPAPIGLATWLCIFLVPMVGEYSSLCLLCSRHYQF